MGIYDISGCVRFIGGNIEIYQKSAQRVNFCNSVGVAKYSPWPLLLKQKVLEILKGVERGGVNMTLQKRGE